MARQYLFFKLSPEKTPYVAAADLFKIELIPYFNNLHLINNVFDLFRFQEIRQLIEKDTHLQRTITRTLPDDDVHGYLAITDNPPPVENLVKRLAFCDEFLVFQRTHELKDTYLRYLAGKKIVSQFKVYNWHVFYVKTLRAVLNVLPAYNGNGLTPEKIDQLFSQPDAFSKHNIAIHPDPIHQNVNFFEPVNHFSSRFASALINNLCNDNCELVEIPAVSAHFLQYASMIGVCGTGYSLSHLNTIVTQMRTHISKLEIHVVTQAVSKIISLISQLLDEPKFRQSHLFYTDINHEFRLYESKILLQYSDIRSYKRHLKLYKCIIASRYLIDHHYITHDAFINLFLNYNLLQTMLTCFNDTSRSFLQEYEKNAQKVINEIQLVKKLHEIFVLKPANISIIEQTFSSVNCTSSKKQAYFIHIPGFMLKNIPAQRNHINIALELYQNGHNKQIDWEVPETIREIYLKGLKTGSYIAEKLDFYRSFLSREEYLLLIKQITKIYAVIDTILKVIRPGDRLAILALIRYDYIDQTPHELSFSRITADYIFSHRKHKFELDFRIRLNPGDSHVKYETMFFTLH
jgi:hypothetical protein